MKAYCFSTYDPSLNVLGIGLSLACCTCLALPMLVAWIIFRQSSMIGTAAHMQSLLQAWAAEKGYRIEHQDCPEKPPFARRLPYWAMGMFFPRDCLWIPDIHRRGLGTWVESMSTLLTFVDPHGQAHRGRMRFEARYVLRLGLEWKPHWEEEPEIPPLLEQATAEAQSHPLWDPWKDVPGGGRP